MEPTQADKLADQLLGNERAKRATHAARVATAATMLQRACTGAATLTAAGLGYVNARKFIPSDAWCIACGIVCGLAASVAWPAFRARYR